MKTLQWIEYSDWDDLYKKFLKSALSRGDGRPTEVLVPLEYTQQFIEYKATRGLFAMDGEPVVPLPLHLCGKPVVVTTNICKGWFAVAWGTGGYPSQVPLCNSHLDNWRL